MPIISKEQIKDHEMRKTENLVYHPWSEVFGFELNVIFKLLYKESL